MSIHATPKDLVANSLKEIAQLIGQRNLPQAARKLNAVAKSAPSDPRVYILGTNLAEAAGNPQGALKSMRRAVALEPNWPVSATEHALLLARLNHFDEAVREAERAIQLAPDSLDVLVRMIDVAHRAQRFDTALQWMTQAARLAPDNLSLKILMARNYRLVGKPAESLAAFAELLTQHPDEAEFRLGALLAGLVLHRPEVVAEHRSALADAADPRGEYRFWQSVADGHVPATLPEGLVQAGFDDLAPVHEAVVSSAGYRVPDRVAELVLARYPERTLNVLDLGCGTGLLGARLGAVQGAIIGVDLSAKMVEQAIRHNAYARFHTVNLLDALAETPAGLYDVITACDAFPYVGDLSKAIPDAARVLKAGGHLVFSCESASADEAALALRPAGALPRYAHQQAAVEVLCRDAGFAEVSVEPIVLRQENNAPVHGFIVVARKAA